MKKKLLCVSIGFVMLSMHSKAQTWNGSPVSTSTSGNAEVSGKFGVGNTSVSGTKLYIKNSTESYALRIDGSGNSSNGLYVYNHYSGSGQNYGMRSYLTGNSSAIRYGMYSHVNAHTPTKAYGYYAHVQGSSSGEKYGVYTRVDPNAPNAWAGYFLGKGYFSDKVGIGTPNPTANLDVHASGENTMAYKGTNGINHLRLVPKLSDWGYSHLSRSGDSGIIWGKYNPSGGLVIAPHASANNGIRITKDGNVGIGTPLTDNAEGYKLAVNGKIGAKSIKVEVQSNAWADYVFEKDYKLLSLDEVKKYIEQNNHLPNVPSASEVEEQGIDLAEINATLLKKIEELTLYTLQQAEQIQDLKSRIEKMEN